jgi:hypothetical protein
MFAPSGTTFRGYSLQEAALPRCGNPSPENHKSEESRPHHHGRFAKSNTTMGVIHWAKMAGILAPLVIGELLKDPDKKWRLYPPGVRCDVTGFSGAKCRSKRASWIDLEVSSPSGGPSVGSM